MNDYYVYVYWRLDTNEPFYVGKGRDRRWKCLYPSRRNEHFIRIIEKHPIAVEIVKDKLTNEQASDIECWIIDKLVFEYGFSIDIPSNRSDDKNLHLVNSTWGGEGIVRNSYWHDKTEEEKEEIRKKISENHEYPTGENHPNYGKKIPKERIEKMLKTKRENNSFNNIPIICITTDEVFNSSIEASKYYNCDASSIIKCCKGNKDHRYCGKLFDGTKLIWMYLEDYKNMSREEIEEKIKNIQYNSEKIICLTTGEVFNSVKQAEQFYGMKKSNIRKCCKGERETCGKLPDGTKLKWMFLKDYKVKEESK